MVSNMYYPRKGPNKKKLYSAKWGNMYRLALGLIQLQIRPIPAKEEKMCIEHQKLSNDTLQTIKVLCNLIVHWNKRL